MSKKKTDIKLNIYPIKGSNGNYITIKCRISERKKIKRILKKALGKKPFIAEIEIKNKWRAIPRLVKLGLIDKKEIDKDTFFKEFLK